MKRKLNSAVDDDLWGDLDGENPAVKKIRIDEAKDEAKDTSDTLTVMCEEGKLVVEEVNAFKENHTSMLCETTKTLPVRLKDRKNRNTPPRSIKIGDTDDESISGIVSSISGLKLEDKIASQQKVMT